MARLIARPVRPETLPRVGRIQMQKFVEGRINKGMVTMVDPADLEPSAMQLVRNATVRFDRTSRRFGSILHVPAKPDSNPVLRLAFIKKQDGVGHTIRMTPDSVHVRGPVAWTPVLGTLNGDVGDRFQTAVVLDEFVFSNNGADNIQKIDFLTDTFAPLGNAPTYRYITGFYNRVVGAARRGLNEVEIGWSGDANIEEWDPLVDESAGSTPLVESPADLSDFITGVFSYSNTMIVLREKSVWLATKQPIPHNPFYFHAAVPGIGCDSPFSVALIGDGLAWLDRRTATVYAYIPGQAPEPIGRPIEKTIIENVEDPALIFSAYNTVHNEYSICIPQVGSNYVIVWTYNRRTRAWTKNEYYAATTMEDTELVEGGAAQTTIDGLGDVPIDDLTGTIDELTPPSTASAVLPTRITGRDDGEIAEESFEATLDAPHTDFPDGIEYETQIVSKAFVIPEDDIYIAQINIEYQSNRGGTFLLEYSLNGGATDTSWKVAKTVTPTVLAEPRLLIWKKFTRARRFAFRLTTRSGLFEVLSYEVHVYKAGKSYK